MVLRVVGKRAAGASQVVKNNQAKAPTTPRQSARSEATSDGDCEFQSRKSERHRTFGWVEIEPGLEVEALEPTDVLKEHGVPERVMLSYLKGEIEGEAAVKNLPAAILLIVWFLLMNLSHELPETIQSIEKAIDFDIAENANFAFSSPLYMGHKNYEDVNTFADWYSWMRVGFSAIYFPMDASVSEGAEYSLGQLTFDEASTYLQHNRKIGDVILTQQRLFDSDCSNPLVSNALSLNCRSFIGLDLRLKPTELDVSQSGKEFDENADPSKTTTLKYLMEFPQVNVSQQLEQLEQTRWLDNSTYRVKVSFMTYNQIYDVLTTTHIHFMFAISGHIFKQITHRSMKLAAHSSWESWVFEVLFFGHITVLFVCEAFEAICTLREHRYNVLRAWKEYWNFWNVVDWVSICLAYAILITWIIQCVEQDAISAKLEDYLGLHSLCRSSAGYGSTACDQAQSYDIALFTQVEELGYQIRSNRWISGFYPVCIMMRLFKAFAAQPRLAIVTKTLALAANDLTHFGIVFLSIFFTYVAMGMAFFGREVESFASFDRACLALLEALMGEFSVEEMELSGRPVAFFFFGTYMMAAVLLLLNMLIAILMDVYGQVAAGSRTSESLWHECWDIMRRGARKWTGEHTPLSQVVKKYMEIHGKECLESDKVIYVDDVMAAVPGLNRKQAEEEMTSALEEYALENSPDIQISEVISTMGKYFGGQVAPAVSPEELEDISRQMAGCPPTRGALASSDVSDNSVQQAAEGLVGAGISVEVLLKAAGIILDRHEPEWSETSRAQVTALRHVISSAELLCREDKTIMMCQL
ncbi:Polycystin-2 (Curly up) (Cup) (Polycystic kidney disease 2 protein homolog) (Transient receptor potential cation channel subfamily P member 2) [Durusdinium trenchii]|uniref:Polycystin-2 (Curly up) (Cup) (Polycystic kidney disease 2 protein homolog) (Transient receptor potential cation channel subfamily P member 2) n=1 Tax=Durusdinium trenchii TaxID=1381693 RepID=A0ABP0M101_9DINO